MAITFIAAGTVANAASGNVTPALPAGWAANDIVVGIVQAADNITVTVPAGWTKKLETNSTATLRQTVFYRRAVAGDLAPVVTHAAGNAIIARLYAFRGCVAAGDPFGAALARANSATATCTADAITPPAANSAVLFVGSEELTGNTSGAPVWGTYSGTNPVFAEVGDNNYELGSNSISGAVAWGIKTDTTTTGSRTAAITGEAATPTANIGTLLALTPLSTTGYATDVLADSPKVYWRAGEPSGNALDSSVNAHPGTVTGTTRAVAGAIRDADKAIQFNGGTDKISVAHHADFDFDWNEAMSLECWVKWSGGGDRDLIAKQNNSAPFRGYALYGSSGQIRFQMVNSAAGANYFDLGTTTVWNDNKYHHVVVTHDGTGATGCLIYVDGGVQPTTISLDNLSATTIDATAPLTAGANAGSGNPLTGSMDEIAAYSGVLSAARVAVHAAWTLDVDAATTRRLLHPGKGPGSVSRFFQTPRSTKIVTGRGTQTTAAQHNAFQMVNAVDPYSYSPYRNRVLEDQPLAYWRQGERSGTTMGDTTGRYPGTYSASGLTLGVTGGLGDDIDPAVIYDGVAGAAQASIDLSSYSQITIEFLLRVASYGTTTLLFELTNQYDIRQGSFISYVVDPGRILVAMWDPTNGASSWIWDTPGVDSFHHYVYKLDRHAGIGSKFQVLVDGNSVGLNNGDTGDMAGNFANAPLNFMSRDGNLFFTAGALDEVAIYAGLLPDARVKIHAQAFVGFGSRTKNSAHPGASPSSLTRFYRSPLATPLPPVSADITLQLSGVSAAASVGTTTPSMSIAVTGNAATAAVGITAPGTSPTISGVAASTSVGSVVQSSAVTLTGVAPTGSAGIVAPSTTVGITGVTATTAVGTVTAVIGVTIALSGVAATGSVGTVTTDRTVAVTGNAATASLGTLTPVVSATISGFALTASVGSLLSSNAVVLPGIAVTGSVGTMTLNSTHAISGLQATTATGTTAPATTVAITGFVATTAVGIITASLSGTSQLGTVGAADFLPFTVNAADFAMCSVGAADFVLGSVGAADEVHA